MLLVFGCLLFILSFYDVTSFDCRKCYSDESMDKCYQEQMGVSCNEDSICYTASYEIFGAWQYHLKGCVKKDQCNSFKICGTTDEFCRYKCCTTENCNSANTKSVSFFTLMVLLSFVLFYQLL